MQTRNVILSDGTPARVVLSGRHNSWYPDLPHCCGCDRAQQDIPLVQCDAVVRGKTNGRCGRYVCVECRKSTVIPRKGERPSMLGNACDQHGT